MIRYFIGSDEISRENWERLHPEESFVEVDGHKYLYKRHQGTFMTFKGHKRRLQPVILAHPKTSLDEQALRGIHTVFEKNK